MADQMSPTAKKSKKKSRGIRKFIPDLKSPNESAHQSNSTRVSVSSASSAHHGTDAGNAEPRASSGNATLDNTMSHRGPFPVGKTFVKFSRSAGVRCGSRRGQSRSQSYFDSCRRTSLAEHSTSFRARALMTLPDSTSQRFRLLGQVARKDQTKEIDEETQVCGGRFREMVGTHFQDRGLDGPQAMVQTPKTRKDCVPVGPEPIPAGVCTGNPDQTYKGPPGWRKIPGNTCVDGVKKDEKVDKKCSQAQPAPGEIAHQIHDFKHQIVQHAYFKNPKVKTILVRPVDHTVRQSSNEGYSWMQIHPEHRFLAFYHHKYSDDRAYLIADADTFYTADNG